MAKTTHSGRVTRSNAGSTTTTTQVDPGVEALWRLAQSCNETLTYCLEQGGEHVEAGHIRCLIDTAEIANITADFIARGSEHVDELKEVAVAVAECTQESCEEFEGDETMAACAEACGNVVEALR